jgi:hypothetical protein
MHSLSMGQTAVAPGGLPAGRGAASRLRNGGAGLNRCIESLGSGRTAGRAPRGPDPSGGERATNPEKEVP